MYKNTGQLSIVLSKEVEEAIKRDSPVIGLESNVIAHGLPFPDNYQLALECDAVIRSKGVTPAVTFVRDGSIHVGASAEELLELSKSDNAPKLTARDLAVSVVLNGYACTTVSASLAICDQVGIPLFASAGLGGVHRDYAESMDVSSDIYDMSRYQVVTVSAGIKKFLDASRTSELLESLSIPIIGYRTRFFPGFYCKGNEVELSHTFSNWSEVSLIARTHLGLNSTGMLIVVEPSDEIALDPLKVEQAIVKGLEEASKNRIQGKALTKFVMHAIDRETNFATSKANFAIMVEICAHAADFANEFWDMPLS